MFKESKEQAKDLNPPDGSKASLDHSMLQINVLTDTEDLTALQDDWDELVEVSDTSIFQTYEWNRAWWKYFGSGKQLYLLAVRDRLQLVGILPLFLDIIHFKGKKIYNCLRLLGSTVSQPEGEDLKGLLPYSDYLDIIARPGFEEAVCQLLLDHLVQASVPYTEIIFDEVPESSMVYKYLLPILKQNNLNYSVSDGSPCVSITLEDCWQEYLNRLSKRARYRVRKYIKYADDTPDQTFKVQRVDSIDDMFDAFERLVTLHQQRWNEAGYPGAFAEERFYSFMKEVVLLFMKKNWAELHVARSLPENLKLIAVDLLFKFKQRVYLVHRAFDIKSELNSLGPGNVLLYEGLRDAIGEGYKVFDFLRGEDSYKFRSADNVATNKILTIANPLRRRPHLVKVYRYFLRLKRRYNLEKAEFHTISEGKSFYGGLTDYLMFLFRRIARKI